MNKRLFAHGIAIIFICCFFIFTWKMLRYLLVDDTGTYTRITMHEFYEQDNIDILFMGASHCYRGFDTTVTDKELGCNTFNLGSSAQDIEVTYLLMKEAVQRYDIKHIYVDLSYSMASQPLDYLVSVYLVTDYMRPSFGKTRLLLEKSKNQGYVNSFLPARREWRKLFDKDYIIDLLERKEMDTYKGFSYIDNEVERYVGKGFVARDWQEPDGTFIYEAADMEGLDLGYIEPGWIITIKQMMEYCDRHKIELTFVSVPISSYKLMYYEKYDEYIKYVNKLIDENKGKANYVDFNLLKENYWKDTSLNFGDNNHLNAKGAYIFSEIFSNYVRGDIRAEDLFYSSIEEKYKAIEPRFYGVKIERESMHEKTCYIISNRMGQIQSRVYLENENQEKVMLTDWNARGSFKIPEDYTGNCFIEVFFDNKKTDVKSYTITF